jgi:hypothetical protein
VAREAAAAERERPRASSRPSGGAGGTFQAVPYSLEYQGELSRVAMLLREAAALTAQPTLKTFLETRAAALLSNDYYESDIAWMELDASVEPTIGPYETYEDEWFGYKAAFEAFITRARRRRDAEAGQAGRGAPDDRGQPADRPKLRNPKLGGWRRFGWSTPCSRRATATAGCRRRPSTCPTTRAWSPRRAPSG